MNAFIIRNTAQVHGIRFAVAWANRRGINPDTVFFALIGRYMK